MIQILSKARAIAIGRMYLDTVVSTMTVGIWGFILSMMILKWVMP